MATDVEEIPRPWRHPWGTVVAVEYPPDRPLVVDLVFDNGHRTAETRHARYVFADGVWNLIDADETAVLNVGDRFEYRTDYAWRKRGEHRDHIHRFRLLIEITKIEGNHASWRTVEVLEETGAPDTDPKSAPTTGGFHIPFFGQLIEEGVIHQTRQEGDGQ